MRGGLNRGRRNADPAKVKREIAAVRPLTEHVETYRLLLRARGGTKKHADDTAKRINRMIALTFMDEHDPRPAAALDGLSRTRIELALGRLRETLAPRTCNHYLRAFKSFILWLAGDELLAGNPYRSIKGFNFQVERRHVRRSLGWQEADALIAAAQGGPIVRGMSGPARAMLYRVALTSGLRANELRKLLVRDLRIDAATTPAVRVLARHAKNRREILQPIPGIVATELRAFVAGMARGAAVFRMPQPSRVVHMLRADLRRAGVACRDEDGAVVDFHAFRHTYITWLCRLCPDLRVVQELARHSTITLTMQYAHVSPDHKIAAVEALADYRPPALRTWEHEASGPQVLATMGRAGIEPATHGFSVHCHPAPLTPTPPIATFAMPDARLKCRGSGART